ncbi:hypothetical protein MJO28_006712 [Puccinia striiformis f. sp. tritici]|uniref:Uncharacterized protein n=1 Tax=Puccinia striiformis f. sp. tritici TaxID=168172 RepID=A0ACC0EIM9_9BASI|nr:hypothetical protein MJO28_006712 [Puccinia striiformis f. sp. tritici]
MAAAPTSSFLTSMSPQPPRTVQSLVNEEARPPPPVRLYPSQHRVSMTRYATSTDPRGFIPVFEYPLNGQYIMIDCETGMVHFTGIWKALGHTKADVVKLVESDPTIAPYLRKVRGGYLKIQGTWLPFETAQTLARRVAWQVRYDLVPLFGPDFPDTCLGPGEPGFGQLLLSAPKPRGRRGAKKNATASVVTQERNASHDSHNQTRPGPHPAQDAMSNRCSGRPEAVGAINSYSPMLTQARYSPYTRAPGHRITQLDPLPGLIQPNQNCAHPGAEAIYSSHYHQSPRLSMMASHGAGPYGQHPPIGSPATGMESAAPLPPMRHYQAHPAENNFFETYRGPDSFEALSNKWLAPEIVNSTSLNHSALLSGDGSCLPPLQYSSSAMPRKESSAPTANQYSFAGQIDSSHPSHHPAPNPVHQDHRNPGYTYDAPHESSYRQEVAAEAPARRTSSPAEQPAPCTTYDKTYTSDTHGGSRNGNAVAGCYAPSVSNSTGNLAGSPGSHSSNVPKSPTPSSASTSTHMQNSHNPNSHGSPSNNLPNMSNNGGMTSQGEEGMKFSVLTSPSHLDSSGPSENTAGQLIHGSDSDWNSAQNPTAVSPNQAQSC